MEKSIIFGRQYGDSVKFLWASVSRQYGESPKIRAFEPSPGVTQYMGVAPRVWNSLITKVFKMNMY